MNQQRTESVIKHIITPIEALFGEFKPEARKIIIESLVRFDDKALEQGGKKVCREVKSFPKLAHIMEACEHFTPSAEQKIRTEKKAERYHCRGNAEDFHKQETQEILGSSIGQRALELGVGRELLLEYEKTGRKDFDLAFVMKAKEFLDVAAQEVVKMTEKNPDRAALESFFDSMLDREKKLYAKFYKQKQQAA